MENDRDLISPIPVPQVNLNQRTPADTTNGSSDMSNIPDTSARTNLSDPLRALRFSEPSNRRNDTSTEIWIECLCLEDAASRNGILQVRPAHPLDWLDLQAVAANLTRNVNINEWSTNSFASREASIAASSSYLHQQSRKTNIMRELR